MKVNLRFGVSLVAMMFVLSLALLPGAMSAGKLEGKGKKDRSTTITSQPKTLDAEVQPAREGEIQATPSSPPQAPSRSRGTLKRIGSFFKELFVSRERDTSQNQGAEESDPDLPPSMSGKIDMQEYLTARQGWVNVKLGMTPGLTYDPAIRSRAIEQMESQRAALKAKANKLSVQPDAADRITPAIASGVWTELGPKPVPNGQTSTVNQPVSGRTVAIAIDPTDPNIVYVGGAQAGVYRTTNGGQTWTPIFDSAQSLVIGALALAPSNHNILYVGTGEAGQCGSGCYAGIGVYRIDNASTTATLTGPINPLRNYNDGSNNPTSANIFSGRSISKILVNPTDPSTIFVATASAIVGNPNQSPLAGTVPPLGIRGIYRLGNATGAPAGVTATKLTVNAVNCFDTPCTGNQSILDMVFDPADATGNTLVCWARPAVVVGDGGVFRSTNAQTTGTFTQTLAVAQAANTRGELASVNIGGVTTMYLASGEVPSSPAGRLRKSTDGGQTWSAALAGASGFCSSQCFYDIAIAIDPLNANLAYVGGSAGTNILRKTTDGFATTGNTPSSQVGLHADNHALAVAPAPNNNIIYDGTDGGIWRSEDSGVTWQSLNNSTYSATQFESIAVHPTDRYFTIGGSQDNGTHMWKASNEPEKPDNQWSRVDFGDGGYARIDQTATDTTSVVMYHTYFNASGSQLGFARISSANCAGEGQWVFKGFQSPAPSGANTCGDVAGLNGINSGDAVQFYAPLELGPPVIGSVGNTVYFGTDRLYRSINKGDLMTVVSQAPITSGQTITTIAISPQDDNYRMVGLSSNGHVWGTTTGSSTLVDITPVGAPARAVGRVFFDPTNKDVAYIAYDGQFGLSGIALVNHIWKTTNFGTGAPTWTATANGIPDVPVNALAVDPSAPANVYAGTDIGVFVSTDSGATWNPYGSGLPAIAVFDMAIQNTNRFLRIATHGRGWWEISLVPAGGVSISGTVTVTGAPDNSGVTVYLNEGQQSVVTGAAGTYTFSGLNPGGNYTVRPELANITFAPSFKTFNDITSTQTNVNFMGSASSNSTPTADSVIISEFREQGPAGSKDEFIELYNNTNSNITVVTPDGSSGWALVGNSAQKIGVIPNGTLIPARGHYLVVGNGYSLRGYAGGDLNMNPAIDIAANGDIGLYNNNTPASWIVGNLIDSVGFVGGDPNIGEGTRLTSIGTTAVEHAFVRKNNHDTNNNAADFVVVSTSGATLGSVVSSLGAPNPEDLASPLHDNATIASTATDPTVDAGASPNRVRCPACTSSNAPFGTIMFSRNFTNLTGSTITRLRFHIIALTTLNNTEGQPSPADLRMLTSASTSFPSASCIQGTMVEQPAVQTIGGGLNTTVTVDLSGDMTTNCNQNGLQGLTSGESLNVQWVLGVKTTGNYLFVVNLEALPHGGGAFSVSGNTENATPTASDGSVNGTITDANGAPVGGVTINLSGGESRETITDANGKYSFNGVETNGFYTVTPSRANYTFSPANRSFSLLGVHTEASFTASANNDHANAIDTTEFFVRQQYLDFLGREPDPQGFNGWVSTLRNCAAGDTSCDRVHVSESFYRSAEFQERGYFAYRFYPTALGRKPDYAEFMPDLQQVSGFLTTAQLEAAKSSLADDFVRRPEFVSRYGSLSNAKYVDALMTTAGVTLANRQTLVDSLNGGTMTRAQVLRQIAESGEVYQMYYNQAFVVMEYFGYLRRDPDALYLTWISILDANPADSRRMVDGFVNSQEYRNRFAP